jgi:hypothetical protein
MRRDRNLSFLLAALLMLFAGTDTATADAAIDWAEPVLEITEKGLNLEAADVPLDQILLRIAELYDTPIAMEGKLAAPVTLSFRDLSLKEAIRRLVGGATFMILHGPHSSDGMPARPSKIWIYASVPGTRSTPDDLSPNAMDEPQNTLESARDAAAEAEKPDPRDATQEDIEAMAERGAPEDLDGLGRVVAEHPDLQMKYLAVTLLGDIHEDRAVLAIERGLGDQDPMFRSYVVDILGTNQALDAVRSLGYVIFGESDPSVRSLAVTNLQLREEEPAREFLLAAASDPDSAVRRLAAGALGTAP